MATYSLATTNAEDAALTAIVAKRNAERAADNERLAAANAVTEKRNKERAKEDPPLDPIPLVPLLQPLTNQQYLSSLWAGILAKYITEIEADNEAAIAAGMKKASPAQIAEVKRLLKV